MFLMSFNIYINIVVGYACLCVYVLRLKSDFIGTTSSFCW